MNTLPQRNDPCWCNSGKKWKKCHYPKPAPQMESPDKVSDFYRKRYGILIKTPEQIAKIRKACTLTANILRKVCLEAKAGVTTNQLDAFAYSLHKEAKAHPAPLGYGDPPYPKSICTSLNDVICHGIPDDTPLVEGDILNIDVSTILDGYYGDCSAMVMIGKVSPEKENVTQVAYDCLEASIKILKPGVPIKMIGTTIEQIAKKGRCSVVSAFVGHGVGLELHEEPQIQHCYNNNTIPLAPGMIFTIEPMINAGTPKEIIDKKTGWIVRTADGKPSAQWEHTLLITEDGCEILTL